MNSTLAGLIGPLIAGFGVLILLLLLLFRKSARQKHLDQIDRLKKGD